MSDSRGITSPDEGDIVRQEVDMVDETTIKVSTEKNTTYERQFTKGQLEKRKQFLEKSLQEINSLLEHFNQ